MTRFLTGVCCAAIAVAQAFAQTKFQVASVKPASPDAQLSSMNGGPMPAGPFNQSGKDPGRIAWTNVRLLRVIQVAYDFPLDRINGPDWLGTQGYDIAAPVPPDTTVAAFRLMLQNLLAERFQLTVHQRSLRLSPGNRQERSETQAIQSLRCGGRSQARSPARRPGPPLPNARLPGDGGSERLPCAPPRQSLLWPR